MPLGSLKSYGFTKPEFNPELYRVAPQEPKNPLIEIAKALATIKEEERQKQLDEQKKRESEATITYKKAYGERDPADLVNLKFQNALEMEGIKQQNAMARIQERAAHASKLRSAALAGDAKSQKSKFLIEVANAIENPLNSWSKADTKAFGDILLAKDSTVAKTLADQYRFQAQQGMQAGLNPDEYLSQKGMGYLDTILVNMKEWDVFGPNTLGNNPAPAQEPKKELAKSLNVNAGQVNTQSTILTAKDITPETKIQSERITNPMVKVGVDSKTNEPSVSIDGGKTYRHLADIPEFERQAIDKLSKQTPKGTAPIGATATKQEKTVTTPVTTAKKRLIYNPNTGQLE